MAIPPRFLDELRARLNVSDVVGKRVRLTRAGREFKGCCPFHNEKTPSFYVNDDKQFYHCFGCGAHGSVIDFVMRDGNQSFPEAVETLASLAGMQVPKSSPEEIEKAQRQKTLYTMMEDATKWMEAQLRGPGGKVALNYMRERGVPDDLMAAFRIGYAPDDMQALRKYLAGQGYTDAQMIEGGVIKTSEKSKEPYAFFRERVMFPVPDRRGRIVAFGGRVLPDHLRAPSRGDYVPAKYINSSDTPLFHKGRMLYGEPHARQAANEGQAVIVVEGYLDVIAAFRGGFRGAVAPLGTALTEDQILVLWKMIPDESKIPILCFDGDNAGRRAASRACERLLPMLQPNHSAKIAFLPEGEDPDSLIKAKGAEGFQSVLDGAIHLIDFLWRESTEGKDFATPESRAGLSKTLEDLAGKITDRGVQHYYREGFRDRVRKAFASSPPSNTAAGAPRPRWQPGYGKGAAPPPMPIVPLRKPGGRAGRGESAAFLACIINNPLLFKDVEEDLGALHFSENKLDHLRQAVLSTLGRDPALDPSALRTTLEGLGFSRELEYLLSAETYALAGFSKPWEDPSQALEGWRGAWAAFQAHAALKDVEAAKTALKADLNEENESRFHALREIRPFSEG